MALRAQKRGYDYSEQIRSNAWELKEDVKEFFQIRNRVLNKIEKSIGEIPFSIHEYFIKVWLCPTRQVLNRRKVAFNTTEMVRMQSPMATDI